MVLNLNKHKGITSHSAVTEVKKLLNVKKAGHAGTLDPIAEGVLIICLGESTKITGYLAELNKIYTVRMKLGERTDTFDSEGRIIEKVQDFCIETERILTTLKGFEGKLLQKIPPYSAVKKDGVPLYKLARKGIKFDTPLKEVFIERLEFLEFDGVYLKIRVHCSKGTYIRRLCDDIGISLGTFAHVTELRRDAIGHFNVKESFTIDDLKDGRFSLIPPDDALKHLYALRLNKIEAKALKNGQAVFLKDGEILTNKKVRLYDGDKFFGIGRVEDKMIRLERLIR